MSMLINRFDTISSLSNQQLAEMLNKVNTWDWSSLPLSCCRGHWGSRGSKAWKILTEDFRVIRVLEFSFILFLFLKKMVESWNIILAPFLLEAKVTFLKKTGSWIPNFQTSEFQNPLQTNSSFHNSNNTFQYETPCIQHFVTA